MIFRPEHAEDICYVYAVNQIFESNSDLFVKQISKRRGSLPMALFLYVFLPVVMIKKIALCCFSVDKMKN